MGWAPRDEKRGGSAAQAAPLLWLAAAAVRSEDRRLARGLLAHARTHPTWDLDDLARSAVGESIAADDRVRLVTLCDALAIEEPPMGSAELALWAEERGVEELLSAPFEDGLALADAITGNFAATTSDAGLDRRARILVEARAAFAHRAAAEQAWRATSPRVDGEAAAALHASATRSMPRLLGDVDVDVERGLLIFTPTAGAWPPFTFSLWTHTGPTCARCDAACTHAEDAASAFLDVLAAPTEEEALAIDRAVSAADWERALTGLDALPPADAPGEREAHGSDVTWRLEHAGDGPRLGAWLRGRRLSVGSLLAGGHGDERDRDAALVLRGGDDEEAIASAVWQLADTGRVTDEQGRVLGVTRGRAELLVEEDDDGGFRVRLALDGCALGEEDDASQPLVRLVDGRAIVTRADRNVRPLADAVKALPARFPAAARGALLTRLVELERQVPVRLPASLDGPEVAGRLELAARLSPTRAGVRVELGGYAIAGAPWLPPGEGPAVTSAVRGGVRVRAQRDLHAESQRARALATQCGLSQADEVAPWVWLVDARAGAKVLDALARSDELQVEWPAGADVWVAGRPAGPEDLTIRVRRGRDWFAIDGEVVVDEHTVSLQRLLEAVRAGRRFVTLSSGHFLQLSEALAARLQRAAPALVEHGDALRAGRAAAPLLDDALFGAGAPAPDDAWEALIERVRLGETLRPKPPKGLRAELRPYQRTGFEWLARLSAWGAGGCLADEMGLGKTVVALALLLQRQEEGPALVVAPTSVCFNWVREAARFTPELKVYTPNAAQLSTALRDAGPGEVIVLSYGSVVAAIDELAELPLATLVLDEAQALKNPQTQRARAVRRLRADARVALSGTPMENHLGELWSLFSVLNPGLLGTWASFFRRFAAPIERDDDDAARASLQRLIRPFLLRRTKAEVAKELPPRTEVELYVDLSDEERALYEAVRRHLEAECHEAATTDVDLARIRVLAALTRLRRLACHPRLDDPQSEVESTKLQQALALLDEIRSSGGRALVFSQFTSHLALIREALDAQQRSYAYLDGSTSVAERARQVDLFQAGGTDAFLISLKAGGTGLNLTAADYVIHLDPWWNPAAEDQATDRAHRMGQTKPVTVYRLIARGTIEERVLELHGEKRRLTARVLDGAQTALPVGELIDLLESGQPTSGG